MLICEMLFLVVFKDNRFACKCQLTGKYRDTNILNLAEVQFFVLCNTSHFIYTLDANSLLYALMLYVA